MEQHLKTKVLDDKALSPSAISCQQQIPKFLIHVPSLLVNEAI